jgi:ribosomal protein S18 acetylase RimI-like enzyme
MPETVSPDAVAVTVRRLKREDADAVRQLDGLILGADRSATWAEYMERFLAFSKLGTQVLPWSGSQIAEVKEGVVGFLLAERQSAGYGLPPGLRVVAIAVHPEFRQFGIGRKLIDALKADSRRQGIKYIYSIVQDRDERDGAFLAACGFEPAAVKVYSTQV